LSFFRIVSSARSDETISGMLFRVSCAAAIASLFLTTSAQAEIQQSLVQQVQFHSLQRLPDPRGGVAWRRRSTIAAETCRLTECGPTRARFDRRNESG
jgi:hypothetical protein